MTFADVERVIGDQLPPAAYDHRAWWSNNPRSRVAKAAWAASAGRGAEGHRPDPAPKRF